MARRPNALLRQLESIWALLDAGGSGGIGPQGPPGPKGDKGDTGETGPSGNDGAPGDDGQSGAKGDKGDQGDIGPQGPVGNDGNDGSDGASGADGPSAFQVALANGYSGTQAQWLASLVGAKGDNGDTGDTGPAGSAGSAGANGSDGNDGAPGDSAYQVAVNQGFGGNVAAWLASLVGPTGNTGPAGSDASVTNANVNTAIGTNAGATRTALALGSAAQSASTDFAPIAHVGAGGTAHANAVASGAAGFLTGADKAKLDGIASAATANDTDANLKARANHTGTQSVSTILAAATARLFGRITASGGAGEELTGTQATSLLDVVGALKGLMSAADKTKLDAIASGATANSSDATLLARANHTGTQSLDTSTDSATRLAMTAAERTKLSGVATGATANSTDAVLAAPYRVLLDSSGSHIAARVAGTYGMGQGDPLAITGTGTLYPLNVIYLDPNDYPAIGALAAKLRIRCIIECNDVAPTGNFTVGLHPVTRPATSGGAGLVIYTIGAAVSGSTAAQNTPAADSQNIIVGSDFAVPAAGFYVLGVVTTAAVATSAHMHFSAQLQTRYA